MVGLSGYHQVLFEDTAQNRLHEALELFEEITGRPGFKETPIFLFLNKKDLYEQMIEDETVPDLTVCFPEYDGGKDMTTSISFIESKFRTILDKYAPKKKLHTHVVAARVRMDMKVSMAEVKDCILATYAKK